jgi:hypothetical protein
MILIIYINTKPTRPSAVKEGIIKPGLSLVVITVDAAGDSAISDTFTLRPAMSA